MTALLLLLTLALAPQSAPPDPELERLTREVSAELRCPVCQGLSLADSPSELAQNMRAVVRDQLAAGRTPDQVKEYFVTRYGEWILLRPKATGFNLAVYLLPLLGLLLGAVALWFAIRRWSRGRQEVAAAPEPEPDLAPWDELVRR